MLAIANPLAPFGDFVILFQFLWLEGRNLSATGYIAYENRIPHEEYEGKRAQKLLVNL